MNEAVNQEIRIRPMAEADTEAAKSIAAGLADAPHWDAKAYAAAIARAGAQQGIALVAEDALGCLAGFNGLIENLIFYRNVSLYLYYIHIPEILAQTTLFGYSLMWLERAAAQDPVRILVLR